MNTTYHSCEVADELLVDGGHPPGLVAPVLEPDLDLPFSQAEAVRQDRSLVGS